MNVPLKDATVTHTYMATKWLQSDVSVKFSYKNIHLGFTQLSQSRHAFAM
jgi:hypothetical protein